MGEDEDDSLRASEAACNHFPSFESKVQGLHREIDLDGRIRFYTGVVREDH